MNFDKMFSNPAKYFDHPEDVETASGLTVAQKLKLLKAWETGARLMQAASNEGMDGGEESTLHRVRDVVNGLQAAQQ